MCHTVFMTTVETRAFSCQRNAQRPKLLVEIRMWQEWQIDIYHLPLPIISHWVSSGKTEDSSSSSFWSYKTPTDPGLRSAGTNLLQLYLGLTEGEAVLSICVSWHFVLLLFIWGRKGKEGASWPRKGLQGCALGIQQPPSGDCCSAAALVWGNGSDSWPCLPFLMHWKHGSDCFCCSHSSHEISVCQRKAEELKSHLELLESISVAVSALQHPLYVHRNKL